MTTTDLAGVCTGPGPCDTTPLGTPGGRKNWVDKAGGLDPYVRAIAHALRRSNPALSEGEAIQRAWGIIRNWAEGKGNVSAETRARAAKAVANMERKRLQSHSLTASLARRIIDLVGPKGYVHGWVRIDASTPGAVERASRAVVTDGHTLLHGPGMVATAHKVVERIKATGHGARVRRVHVAGKAHLHVSRTTR